MKNVIRIALGIIFSFVFLLFLLTTSLKFKLLQPMFWTDALETNGVYKQLVGQIGQLGIKMENDVKNQTGGVTPKELLPLLDAFKIIDKQLDEARLQELVETNISRLFDYLNKKTLELALFLPVTEWNLPVAILGQPMMAKWTAQTPIKDVLDVLFSESDQADKLITGIDLIREQLVWLNIILVVLLGLASLLLVGYYFLGVGQVARLKGIAWLLIINGILAKLIGIGGTKLLESMVMSLKNTQPWVIETGKTLIKQFFPLGETVGLAMALIGLIILITTNYLIKQKKLTPALQKTGLLKRAGTAVAGIILGTLILLLGTGVVVLAFGGKVDFKTVNKSEVEGVQRLTNDVYRSERGWQIKFPAGWEVIKDEKSEGVMKKPTGTVVNWVTIEIGSADRTEEIDSGTYIEAMKQGLGSASSFKNAVFFEEPYEEIQVSTGWHRFVFTVDYDEVIANQTMRVRFFMIQFFPKQSGSGFTIVTRVPVESWDRYEKIIKESVNTFRADNS